MIALLLFALLQGAPSAAPSVPGPLRLGVLVQPETVTVGDHFLLRLRVQAPRGSRVAFPAAPDSGLTIEAVDPRTIHVNADSGVVDQTAEYRLVAWDTGGQRITLGDVVVTAGGTDRRVPVTGAPVFVRSVLPRDTALRVPKPARDVFAAPPAIWPWLLAALLALLLLLLLWWWLSRRRRRPPPPVSAHAEAEREFERIERLGLLEAGERGRYVALVIDVVRDYLAARVAGAARSLTSSELLGALRSRKYLPPERLAPLLGETDLVKFARRPVTTERAREIGREARAIVNDVERAAVIEAERAERVRHAAAHAAPSTGRAA